VKHLRYFVAAILVAGLCLTGRALYLHAKAELAGVLIRRAWQVMARSGESRPPWPWADTHPAARLRIPRLGYDEIVLEGATPGALAFGPARLLSGAALGEPGNLELAGHRDSWFEPLQGISLGDTIELEWYDSRRAGLRARTYIVDDIRVVVPEDLSQLAPTSDDALTLITCYPFGRSPRSPQRYIVRALPVGPGRSTWSPPAAVDKLLFGHHLSAQVSCPIRASAKRHKTRRQSIPKTQRLNAAMNLSSPVLYSAYLM
jgi:sortase A